MGSLINQSDEAAKVAVVMVPFPAQGHLNQLMQLSCLLSKYVFQVHYIGSSIHNRQARVRVNGLNPQDVSKIHFHDVPIPTFESPSPDPDSSSKFPVQLQPAWDASLSQRQPIFEFLRDLASKSKRVVVIHDPLMAFVVQDVVSIPNAESYVFNCLSAFTQATYTLGSMGKRLPFELPKEIPPFERCASEDILNFLALQSESLQYRAGDLYNTSRLIAGPYLDILADREIAGDRKSWAIGPIIPTNFPSRDSPPKCLQWLDQQEPNSVIYVSFGTTTSLSDEEIKELALGLEQSRQKFIWVLRDADKGDIFAGEVRQAKLPEGFEERVVGVGIVVRDWAPQPEILAHQATGGFLSHCGWNSFLESVTTGVPIAAWPMHSDQPRNAFLITEILKVGIVVREWDPSGEVVKASTIANVVKTLMASEDGEEIRKRAEKLGAALRQSIEEGGVSQLELDSFIAHISM
ncbi:zeatin O-glucosyltransferase-like [Primulina huaijiensis]|uniref:zeatin O-glucosyltransferase-like n=1 Tax=Primulina huaijiensis TaxID=1492673 RepID=UPI003CC79C3D